MTKLIKASHTLLPIGITFLTFVGGAYLNQSLQILAVAKIVLICNIGAYLLSMFYALWFLVVHADDKMYPGYLLCSGFGAMLMGSMAIGDVMWYIEEYSDLRISVSLNLIWSVFELGMAVLVFLMVYTFWHTPTDHEHEGESCS